MNGSSIARGWGVGVVALGLATAGRPDSAADVAAGATGGRPDPRIVRVLGLRQTAQGVLVALHPTPGAVRFGVLADASHALSMFGLAAASPRYRRAALLSAGIATASTGVGLLATRPH